MSYFAVTKTITCLLVVLTNWIENDWGLRRPIVCEKTITRLLSELNAMHKDKQLQY